MILLAVGLTQQCVSYLNNMVTRYSVIANLHDYYGTINNNCYYCFIPQPSHLAPAPLQSTSQQHDPVTSVQTFRDILEHGSKLSDAPKHQKSITAPPQHSYVELDETVS